MAMDSDISNADAALWVEFYDTAVEQSFLSSQEGRPIYHDAVFIKIRVPGNDTLEIDRPMIEDDKRRFPMQWAHYTNKMKDGSQAGTPIAELPGVTKAVVENLRVAKFHTVEQVANAGDQALQGLRMSIGMDPLAFRLRCQRFLGEATEYAHDTRMEEELKQRDAVIGALQGQMKQMQEMMTAQREWIETHIEVKEQEEAPPKKDKAAA